MDERIAELLSDIVNLSDDEQFSRLRCRIVLSWIKGALRAPPDPAPPCRSATGGPGRRRCKHPLLLRLLLGLVTLASLHTAHKKNIRQIQPSRASDSIHEASVSHAALNEFLASVRAASIESPAETEL